MDDSPGSDAMDWKPDTSPNIIHQTPEPFNRDCPSKRRTFDDFSDGSEPMSREAATPYSTADQSSAQHTSVSSTLRTVQWLTLCIWHIITAAMTKSNDIIVAYKRRRCTPHPSRRSSRTSPPRSHIFRQNAPTAKGYASIKPITPRTLRPRSGIIGDEKPTNPASANVSEFDFTNEHVMSGALQAADNESLVTKPDQQFEGSPMSLRVRQMPGTYPLSPPTITNHCAVTPSSPHPEEDVHIPHREAIMPGTYPESPLSTTDQTAATPLDLSSEAGVPVQRGEIIRTPQSSPDVEPGAVAQHTKPFSRRRYNDLYDYEAFVRRQAPPLDDDPPTIREFKWIREVYVRGAPERWPLGCVSPNKVALPMKSKPAAPPKSILRSGRFGLAKPLPKATCIRGISRFADRIAVAFGRRGKSPSPAILETPARLGRSVAFAKSPRTGRPVTRVKKYVIGEAISYPSPSSSRDESSILNSPSVIAPTPRELDTSPTMAEQVLRTPIIDDQAASTQLRYEYYQSLHYQTQQAINTDSGNLLGSNDIHFSRQYAETDETGAGPMSNTAALEATTDTDASMSEIQESEPAESGNNFGSSPSQPSFQDNSSLSEAQPMDVDADSTTLDSPAPTCDAQASVSEHIEESEYLSLSSNEIQSTHEAQAMDANEATVVDTSSSPASDPQTLSSELVSNNDSSHQSNTQVSSVSGQQPAETGASTVTACPSTSDPTLRTSDSESNNDPSSVASQANSAIERANDQQVSSSTDTITSDSLTSPLQPTQRSSSESVNDSLEFSLQSNVEDILSSDRDITPDNLTSPLQQTQRSSSESVNDSLEFSLPSNVEDTLSSDHDVAINTTADTESSRRSLPPSDVRSSSSELANNSLSLASQADSGEGCSLDGTEKLDQEYIGLRKEGDDDVFVEFPKANKIGHHTQPAARSPSPDLPTAVAELVITPRKSDLDTSGRRSSERKKRRLEAEAKEQARLAKEAAEVEAQLKREVNEQAFRDGLRRIPKEKVILPLTPEVEQLVTEALKKNANAQVAFTSTGNPITRRDIGKVLPQPGTTDDPSGWLNDEIVAAYLQMVTDYAHEKAGHKRNETPKFHSFNPFFYTNLKKKGYEGVKRWAKKAKIGGKDLEEVEWVFIPVNDAGNHWTMVVVSPKRKTMEYLDSMHHRSAPVLRHIKDWLKGELGSAYKETEWTVREQPGLDGIGGGPSQDNAKDCGVFAVTSAKMVALGVDPMAVSADDMPTQRRRMVAEILNGGFSGAFEPNVEFN